MASAVFNGRWANDFAPNVVTNQMNPQNFVFYIVNGQGQAGLQVGGTPKKANKKGKLQGQSSPTDHPENETLVELFGGPINAW